MTPAKGTYHQQHVHQLTPADKLDIAPRPERHFNPEAIRLAKIRNDKFLADRERARNKPGYMGYEVL